MASVWEIHEPGVLDYESTLGVTTADAGDGPPVMWGFSGSPNDNYGWVRYGYAATASGSGANCSAYTSSSVAQSGLVAGLHFEPGATNSGSSAPWYVSYVNCSLAYHVWCAED